MLISVTSRVLWSRSRVMMIRLSSYILRQLKGSRRWGDAIFQRGFAKKSVVIWTKHSKNEEDYLFQNQIKMWIELRNTAFQKPKSWTQKNIFLSCRISSILFSWSSVSTASAHWVWTTFVKYPAISTMIQRTMTELTRPTCGQDWPKSIAGNGRGEMLRIISSMGLVGKSCPQRQQMKTMKQR